METLHDNPNKVISAQNLTHRFGDALAVNDLTFTVGQGEVFGLLGPNGAGKTTTVRLLNGLYQPTGGSMHVLGFDPTAQGELVRRRTGVLTETPALYERLTARQNLAFFAELADMPQPARDARIAELLSFFDLDKRAGDRVATYSKGMKQRLALARALLHRPELVFLDEPTSGLDPESAQQVHALISDLRRRDGHTVFLCTHNLTEAERLCDRLGIMNHGRLLAAGTLAELRRLVAPGLWVQVDFLDPFEPADLPGALRVERAEGGLRVQVEAEARIPALVAALVGQGAQILRVQPREISLEEIYFHLQHDSRGDLRPPTDGEEVSRGADGPDSARPDNRPPTDGQEVSRGVRESLDSWPDLTRPATQAYGSTGSGNDPSTPPAGNDKGKSFS